MRVTLCSLSSQYIHLSLAPWCLRAAVLAARPEDEVCVCEMNINDTPESSLRRLIETRPDAVGLSVYIWNRAQTARLVRSLKALFPALPVALGGPEVTFSPEETLREIPCDAVLRGAGEASFPRWLDTLEGAAAEVPGLCCRGREGLRIAPPAPTPPPTTAPYSPEYFAALAGRMAYAETTRGCPFSCAFCLSGQRERVQALPKEEALALLLRLGKSGSRIVKLIDRTFNYDHDRTRFLLGGLIRARACGELPPVCYHLEVGADLFDETELALLKTAPPGLFQMEAGLQSFHPETLARCQRTTDMDRLTRNLRALLAPDNIHLHVDLIAGLPEEDLPTFTDSFDQAWALGPHMLQLGFLKLIHGSRLRAEAAENACRFSPDPPYEVLATKWLSYADVCLLKDVEQALDRVGNSGRFRETLGYALAETKLRPFALLRQIGEAMRSAGARLSQEALTQTVFDVLCALGLDAEVLRDKLVLDRLATDNTGFLPAYLQRDLTRLKAETRRLRESDPALRRARFALLQGGRALAVADWTALHPVTLRGEVTVLPLSDK